ncbi:transcriptional regulator [Flavobacterium capsici]|uniref:Transcriptional regulator n=1 Tax=Flavobacterium capsici TaxID=3075618 RepID=A0AA96EZE9_9FLAO|nr:MULTISPECIES: transcriptional regulator [unclassified Flavobacterium]WNM18491.1 transcriptional regulator [Flavobacterium sp. PMR2A8]WNM22542.1 transcriptional regulator [Flavobacterium sp. PMTSA4]
MNYIKHLTGFFDRVAKDKLLNPTHVSLYIALFQFWNCNRFKNPISISRDEVMRISKISSKATYHKCLKNLHAQGYIKYEPSYNPFKGSHVFLFNFSDDLKPLPKSTSSNSKPVIEQVVNKSCTSDETSSEQVSEQVLVPYINNINISNDSNNEKIANLNDQAKNFEDKNNSSDKIVIPSVSHRAQSRCEGTQKEKKLRKKKKSFIEPDFQEIKSYFQENNFPELEAQKFFNYFSSIGWLVGGKTPMIDWQAAAQNWILNSVNFNHNNDTTPTNRPKYLNTTTDKNYAEPL